MVIHIAQIIIFLAYVGFFWNRELKSISMSSYQKRGFVWFTLFMIATALPFAFEENIFFQIATWALIVAGLSHRHQTPVIKQIHHVTSTIAILCGFLAIGSWWAVGIFLILTGVAFLLKRAQLLWYLEIIAFLVIKTFQLCKNSF